VRRLAEWAPEFGQKCAVERPRSARQRRHIEWLLVAGVDQVLGTEKVACWGTGFIGLVSRAGWKKPGHRLAHRSLGSEG
jgi:hypothetical protein